MRYFVYKNYDLLKPEIHLTLNVLCDTNFKYYIKGQYLLIICTYKYDL